MIVKKRYYIYLLIIPFLCGVYSLRFYFPHGAPFDIWFADKMHYNQRGKYGAMAHTYARLVIKYPDRPELKYSLAWAYYKTGRYDEARRLVNEYVNGSYAVPQWRWEYIERIRKGKKIENGK